MHTPIKLVVAGPVGAGKTTFIQLLSEIDVVETEEIATEAIGKKTTTVAMDFGSMTIEGQPIHLFGTPGQERFNFMWDVLCEGAHGLLFLVAGNKPEDFSHARRILEFITSQVPIPFLVGVTRLDLDRVWSPGDVADYLEIPSHLATAFNATDYDHCTEILYELFDIINNSYAEPAN